MKKKFCSKNINTKIPILSQYSAQFKELFQFKLKMNKLLEKKIFQYSMLNNSVNEISQLNQLTKKQTQKYKTAAEEPYSFLYVNIRAKKFNDFFMIRFEKHLHIED
jgi:hypothetical protein